MPGHYLLVTPGLRPGSVALPCRPGDPVGMAVRLVRNVADHRGEVSLVDRCRVEAPGPANCAGDAAVGAHCGHAFRQANEIAQSRIRTKAHHKVHMVGQNRTAEDAYARVATGARNSTLHIRYDCLVNASHPPPGTPRNVSVELKGSVARHRRHRFLTDPGRKPGEHHRSGLISSSFLTRAPAREHTKPGPTLTGVVLPVVSKLCGESQNAAWFPLSVRLCARASVRPCASVRPAAS